MYEVCPKSIETEAVFTKREINNERKVNFLQNSPKSIEQIYSSEFVEAPLKLLFSYCMKQYHSYFF